MSEPAAPPPLTDEQKRAIHRRPVDPGSWVTPATAIGGIYYDDSGEIQLPGVSPEYWKTQEGMRTRLALESAATGGRWNEQGLWEPGTYSTSGNWKPGERGTRDSRGIAAKALQQIPGYNPELIKGPDRNLFDSSWTDNAINNFLSTYAVAQGPISERLARNMVAAAHEHAQEQKNYYGRFKNFPALNAANRQMTRELNRRHFNESFTHANRPAYTPYFFNPQRREAVKVEHLLGGKPGSVVKKLDQRAQRVMPFRDEKWDEGPGAGTRYTIPAQ